MTISIIVAMDQNQVIGNQGALPWHLPEDLKYFRRETLDKTVIMGRKTYESLGRPLPQRTNIVLTRDEVWGEQVDIPTFQSVEETVNWIHDTIEMEEEDDEFFVIGGKEIYQHFYPYADRFYVTHIEHEFEGDVQWNEFDWNDWRSVWSEKGPKDEKNPYDYWFAVYERKVEDERKANQRGIR